MQKPGYVRAILQINNSWLLFAPALAAQCAANKTIELILFTAEGERL
jgi:hypothetical protein